ncbi:MAG: intradiol ring-cleavage dioxygenase [Pseudomonadota bacterium]|nr:intradiol ring-cleavage dioxygenase [Pseudomonadota bacterium]
MADPDRRAAALGMALFGGALAMGACGNRSAPGQAVQGGRVRADLYNCEGCEASEERAAGGLPSRLAIAGPAEPGERMVLSGRVLAAEDATAVEGVVIYAHQTNAEGLYADGGPETLWSRRHGRLRGWVRSDAEGRYAFDTIKPAPYPDMTLPAHIHLYIKEPGRRPYYIDDVVFEGEFGVTAAYRARSELRGGDGVVRLGRTAQGVWIADRDIRLERHPVEP